MFDIIKNQEYINNKLLDIEDRSLEIPFDNSKFQNINFIENSQMTPERAYRALLLRINNRIRACKECIYSIRKEDIDIDELKEKINDSKNYSKYDIARWEIDIEQKIENRKFTEKLFLDAKIEIQDLYVELSKYPRFTREQFESGEVAYFEISLKKQILGINGALDSLLSMGYTLEDLKNVGIGFENLISVSKTKMDVIENE